MKKTQFIFIVVLIVSLLIFSGCNKKSENTEQENSELELGTKIGQGIVNTNEIGGDNLIVVTVYKLSSEVLADESFSTIISSEGAQLIMVQDAQSNLRAYVVSLPQNSDDIIFDAVSTAKATIFFTPGILVIDPQEAETKLNKIEKLSCFTGFTSFLRTKLKNVPLTNLITNEEYTTHLTNCIVEYNS